MYCAATAADCPFVAKKAQPVKMAKNRQCGPDETSSGSSFARSSVLLVFVRDHRPRSSLR